MNTALPILVLSIIVGCNAQTLKVSIYYESLCPDSKEFISNQLFPAYKQIGKQLELDFVPYGRATSRRNNNGQWTFTCQHGSLECFGNKIHSCAIGLYSSPGSAEFIHCSMSNRNSAATDVLAQCAAKTKLPWDSLATCFNSGQADKFLVSNGQRTQALGDIPFIPEIVFNNSYNSTLQDKAFSSFFRTACDLLSNSPQACQHNYLDNTIEAILIE